MKDPRGTARWRKTKELAKRRDMRVGARCHICGDIIDYYAVPGTPYAYEADHYPMTVKQMVDAGHPEWAFDLKMVKPCHCSCNRSDGGRMSTCATGLDIGTPTRAV